MMNVGLNESSHKCSKARLEQKESHSMKRAAGDAREVERVRNLEYPIPQMVPIKSARPKPTKKCKSQNDNE